MYKVNRILILIVAGMLLASGCATPAAQVKNEAAPAAHAPDDDSKLKSSHFMFKLKPNDQKPNELNDVCKNGTIRLVFDQWYKCQTEERTTEENLTKELKDEGKPVANLEIDQKVKLNETPDDPKFAPDPLVPNAAPDTYQWGLKQASGIDIKAEQGWNVTKGTEQVTIAVLDSGLDINHPDFYFQQDPQKPKADLTQPNNIWTNPDPGSNAKYPNAIHGWNFTNNKNDVSDTRGHGTHVAGIAAARGDNGIGLAGVAWNTKIMPLNRGERLSNTIEATNFAITHDANVINASYGSNEFNDAEREVIEKAGNQGIVFVAAAGNDGDNNDESPNYPAGYDLDNIVSVANLMPNGNLKPSSNFGRDSVDVAAPGTNIISTLPDNKYGLKSGTSMAAPHVSGLAALIVAKTLATPSPPPLNMEFAKSIKARILDGTKSIPGLAKRCKVLTGGLIDMETSLSNNPLPEISCTPKIGSSGEIVTVAGTGDKTFDGDSSPLGPKLKLHSPQSTAIDSDGNVLIADKGNQRIRKVTPGGIMTTIAGNGTKGSRGDGSKATQAQLNDPAGVAVDPAGNIYIAEGYIAEGAPEQTLVQNHIRKVTPDGNIHTIAGGGSLARRSADGHPATEAKLGTPTGIAVDAAGNVYFSETITSFSPTTTTTGSIRKIAANGTLSTVVDEPGAVNGVSLAGDSINPIIYFTEDNRVFKLANGVRTLVAGNGESGFSGDDGPAIEANLNRAQGVATDGKNSIYIADAGNDVIRKVNPDGIITTFARPENICIAADPRGVTVANGSVYIAVTGNATVDQTQLESKDISTIAGTSCLGYNGNTHPRATHLNVDPSGIASDRVGNIYIADRKNNRVRKLRPDGYITTFAGHGNNGSTGDSKPAIKANLNAPIGTTVDDTTGNVYIAQKESLRKVSPDGTITTIAGTRNPEPGFDEATKTKIDPQGIAFDSGSNALYVTETEPSQISKITPDGKISTITKDLSAPKGIAAANGTIYVADTGHNQIKKISPDGTATIIAGAGAKGSAIVNGGSAITAELDQPQGVAIDPSCKSTPDTPCTIFISDTGNNRVLTITPDGNIHTSAGNGTRGFSGDDGPATSAQLDNPTGITVTPTSIYISDEGNNRIRQIIR